MAKINSLIAIIPVKGNSERVPKKNIRPFGDTSLLALKIGQIKKVKGIDEIVVSSEDESVLEYAANKGVSIHKRDPYYSTSSVPMSEVYSYLASEFKQDTVIWTQVTNPLANAQVYEEGIKKYLELDSNHDCVLSAIQVKEYLFYNEKPINFKPNPWPRSQDLKGICALNFVVNILKREDMVKWGSLVGEHPYFMMMDRVTSLDIDVMDDFELCEHHYLKNPEKYK